VCGAFVIFVGAVSAQVRVLRVPVRPFLLRKWPLIRPATAGWNACRGPPSPLGEGKNISSFGRYDLEHHFHQLTLDMFDQKAHHLYIRPMLSDLASDIAYAETLEEG